MKIWYYVYVDNLGVLGADEEEVEAIMKDLKTGFWRPQPDLAR